MKCKTCSKVMEKLPNISFGDAHYEQYKCSACKKIEYKCLGVKIVNDLQVRGVMV